MLSFLPECLRWLADERACVCPDRGFHILNQVAFFGAANMADWLAECLQVKFYDSIERTVYQQIFGKYS